MVNVVVDVAKIVGAAGLAVAVIILAKKTNPDDAKEILNNAADAAKSIRFGNPQLVN